MPNLFAMVDLRHMFWAEEPFEDIEAFAAFVRHVHMDYPRSYPQRLFPKPTDDYDYAPFLEAVKRSGYDDTLTIEADVPEDWESACQDVIKVSSLFFN